LFVRGELGELSEESLMQLVRESLDQWTSETSHAITRSDHEPVAIDSLVPMCDLEVRLVDDVAVDQIIDRRGTNHGLSSCNRDDI